MNDATAQGVLVDRLRANLDEAGIPLADRDLERILETKLLATAEAFERLCREGSAEGLPDYLGARGAPGSGGAGSKAAATSPAARDVSVAPSRASDTIASLAPRIRRGELSPVTLVEGSLQRIAARDSELNAFQLVMSEPARAAARAAEREISAGRYRGPLHGVPLAVKDLLAVSGTPTSAGSRVLDPRPSERTATGVDRLVRAGAIIVGKTRMPEFAYSPGSNNPNFGPTRNPHDVTRDTGGSSSGSGAAVAAGMVIAALGSDTGGSIRIPASLCGIVGLKPTFGRVSLEGAVSLAWSLDHLGPMTRSVTDAALMLEALAEHDPLDARTRPVPAGAYLADIEAGVRGLRIGVLGDDGAGEPLGTPEAVAAWRAGLDALSGAGAVLETIDLPAMAEMRVVNYAILAMEAAVFHRRWLHERSAAYGEFARLRLLAAHAYAPGGFIRAQQMRARLRAAIEARLAEVDLLSTPTMPDAAPPLGVPAPTRFTSPFNLLGWPAITIPVGTTTGGMPLGLQLAGKPWDEATVLRAARAVEKARAIGPDESA